MAATNCLTEIADRLCHNGNRDERDPTVKKLASLALAPVVVLSAACGSGDDGNPIPDQVDCSKETRADTYAAGMSKTGAQGFEFRLMEAAPTPPAKGDNDWTIEVLDASSTPMDGISLDITPFMPDHGHGTTVNADITPTQEAGTYDVNPVNLWMPGYWEITVDASDDSGPLDSAVFAFCIEG